MLFYEISVTTTKISRISNKLFYVSITDEIQVPDVVHHLLLYDFETYHEKDCCYLSKYFCHNGMKSYIPQLFAAEKTGFQHFVQI